MVPVVREEVHADTVPVVTGGVRVTKRVENHDEIVEQELRKSNVEVKRVKTNRVVDGPQPVQRTGNTLIVPVVSEVLRVEKQWVVTEEIHITEAQERETVQNKVTLSREEAQVERVDNAGNAVSTVDETRESSEEPARPIGIMRRAGTPDAGSTSVASKRRPRSGPRSILNERRSDAD